MYSTSLLIGLFVLGQCVEDELLVKKGKHSKSKHRKQRMSNNELIDTGLLPAGSFVMEQFICYPRTVVDGETDERNDLPAPYSNAREDMVPEQTGDGFYESIASLAFVGESRDDESRLDSNHNSERTVRDRESRSKRHRRRRPTKSRSSSALSSGTAAAGQLQTDMESFTDNQDESLELEHCSATDHEVYRLGVTKSSPQYTMTIRAARNHTDALLKSLHDRFLPRQQPELGKAHSICDRRLVLGKGWDTSARAICPFRWVMDEPNPARFPERLMTARCSCQLSKPMMGLRAKCVEVKERIPVLWRVRCSGHSHVYREGYDEISVACVPVGFIIENGIAADSIEGSDLLYSSS